MARRVITGEIAVISARSGSGSTPFFVFAVVVLALVAPRAVVEPSPGRWVWLVLAVAVLTASARAWRVGRVTMDDDQLSVWTVWRVRRFPTIEVELASTTSAAVGVARFERDVLTIRSRGHEHRIDDVNVSVGSGRLDNVCAQINARLVIAGNA